MPTIPLDHDNRTSVTEVRVAVRTAGLVRVTVGRTRADLSPIDALELAGRLEMAAEFAERRAVTA